MSIRTRDPNKKPMPIGTTIRAVHSAHPAWRTAPDERELRVGMSAKICRFRHAHTGGPNDQKWFQNPISALNKARFRF